MRRSKRRTERAPARACDGREWRRTIAEARRQPVFAAYFSGMAIGRRSTTPGGRGSAPPLIVFYFIPISAEKTARDARPLFEPRPLVLPLKQIGQKTNTHWWEGRCPSPRGLCFGGRSPFR